MIESRTRKKNSWNGIVELKVFLYQQIKEKMQILDEKKWIEINSNVLTAKKLHKVMTTSVLHWKHIDIDMHGDGNF